MAIKSQRGPRIRWRWDGRQDPSARPGLRRGRPWPAWGFDTRHVENLTFEDCRMTCTRLDQRPRMICGGVKQFTLEGFKLTRCKDIDEPVVLHRVGNVRLSDPDTPWARK